jgi:hypothetical protein
VIAIRTAARSILVSGLVTLVAIPTLSAQRGGGRGGGSEIQPGGTSGAKASRLEIMTKAFTLDADQVKQFRDAFDAGQKEAVPVKLALQQAHAAIGAAIQGAKGQAEIDSAVREYATQAATMNSIEVKSLAAAMKSLHPEQLEKKASVDGAFSLLHGMFLGKWDSVPDGKTY